MGPSVVGGLGTVPGESGTVPTGGADRGTEPRSRVVARWEARRPAPNSSDATPSWRSGGWFVAARPRSRRNAQPVIEPPKGGGSWGNHGFPHALKRRQVALELPLAHLHAVLVPLIALERDQAVAQLEAERLLDQRRLLGQVDRLAERLGQRLDSERVPLRLRQRVQVGLHRVGQLVALLDPLEAGVQQRREREVGVRSEERR